MVPTAGGDAVRYTAPGYESSGPRFSPDGKYLFFSSSRPGGTGNSWAIRMDAPGGEAAQVADYPTGSWPRDGKFAVFAATVTEDSANAGAMGAGSGGPNGAAGRGGAAAANDPFGRMQPMARPPFGAITRPVDPARFDGRHSIEYSNRCLVDVSQCDCHHLSRRGQITAGGSNRDVVQSRGFEVKQRAIGHCHNAGR